MTTTLPGGHTDAHDLRRPEIGARRRAELTRVLRERLTQAWVDAVGSGSVDGIALAAVGSLARGDVGPRSDVDLVLLAQDRVDAARVESLAQRLWYPLWDEGLRIDHSVRTPAQCRQIARDDLPALVGLIDLVAIAGDLPLVTATRAGVLHDWRAEARLRLQDLLDHVEARHVRHGDLSALLEPDLKEARGGLRDATVIDALCAAWLADRPHGGAAHAARTRLLDVRDAVHHVTGRHRSRLGQEDQDAVAALLGLEDRDVLLREVIEAGRVLGASFDSTVRSARHAHLARGLRTGPRRPRLTPLGHGAYAHDGEVVLRRRPAAEERRTVTLRAATAAARADLPLAPATLAGLVPEPGETAQAWGPDDLHRFTDLLACGPGLVRVWESLTLSGIVEAWLPGWSRVRSLPQRNPVHRHTVDRHQVETVIEATRLATDVRRPDVLLLAALLHDVGKAGGGVDHGLAGVEPAEAVLTHLGVTPADAEVVTFLVRHHLTLTELATRSDPDDPATLDALCAAVDGDRDRLDLLRALAEADARSAGPAAWTSWRQRLVDHLTTAARSRLPLQPIPSRSVVGAGSTVHVVAPDRIGLFADVAGILGAAGVSITGARLSTRDGVARDWWEVDDERQVLDPADLGRSLRRLGQGDRTPLRRLDRHRQSRLAREAPAPVVVVHPGSGSECVMELRAPDRPALLHDVARALADLDVDVRGADIATYAGHAVDSLRLRTGLDAAEITRAVVAVLA